MEPSSFEQANINLGPPEGMTEDQVRTLRAYRDLDGDAFISCWKPTQDEGA